MYRTNRSDMNEKEKEELYRKNSKLQTHPPTQTEEKPEKKILMKKNSKLLERRKKSPKMSP